MTKWDPFLLKIKIFDYKVFNLIILSQLLSGHLGLDEQLDQARERKAQGDHRAGVGQVPG